MEVDKDKLWPECASGAGENDSAHCAEDRWRTTGRSKNAAKTLINLEVKEAAQPLSLRLWNRRGTVILS